MYPENWAALEVFAALGTQWRTGAAGATGLDYGVLPGVMDLLCVAPDDRRALFADIRVMEGAALKEMTRKRKR